MNGTLQRQETLIEALRTAPGRLEPGSTSAQCLETHISWIILTDSFAFKFKKALDLGFLDYSTLDRRLRFCHEELRLNRRTAPGLYLDVVGFGGSPETPEIGHEPTFEYAVKMRRFSQDALLDKWAQEHRITPAHIDTIAEQIAQFHKAAAVAEPETPYGRPETVLHPIDENFEHIRETLESPRQRVWLDEQEVWVTAQFTRLRRTMERRKEAGFVRECHGDLHLGNLAEIDGQIVPFDCIEFNPALRWIDVMSEIAFLTMDLEHRGYTALASRLLDRYLRQTGDYEGLTMLRFYQHYRAMVRAKVALIRLAQEDLPQKQRLRGIEEFGAYLSLAGHYAQPPAPALIITFGPSGCGKTYLTDSILQSIGAVRIRSDVERKRLFGLEPEEESRSGVDSGIYTSNASVRTYARLTKLAEHILDAGYPCIVDATFLRREQRGPFEALAARKSVPFIILELSADRQTLEQRIATRRAAERDASEADLVVLANQLRSTEPLQAAERKYSLSVDTSGQVDIDRLVEQVRELLKPLAPAQ